MRKFLPKAPLEDIKVCGEAKALHLVDDPQDDPSWQKVNDRLSRLMKPLGFAPSALAAYINS
jgi:hypothetical protein